MESADPRAALVALVAGRGDSLAALSRLLGRNDAYLQQFVTRGTPRTLAEADRRLLAAYFGVGEETLGGSTAAPALVRIPRLDAIASAGPGGLVEEDRMAGGEAIDPAVLRQLGVRADGLSIVVARGDSMYPTIADGDEMLVDRHDRRVDARGGIYVARIDGDVVVKRLIRNGRGLTALSDNPAFPAPSAERIEVVGRVCRLSRTLR